MTKSFSRTIIITVILLIAIPAGISPPARATPSYTPGVKVGESVTYGLITISYNHTAGIPDFLQKFNDTKSITDTVTAVDLVAKTVTMTQTFLFKNLTSVTTTMSGNVQNGNGNLSIFILAGGLSAGDPLTQSSQYPIFGFPFIAQTVTRLYAGTLRTVNAEAIGSPSQIGQFGFGFYWDQSTGFLLELSESLPTSSSNPQAFAITIRTTSTNIWQSSSASDFSLDAVLESLPALYQGQHSPTVLNLTSFNGFSGTASLTTHLLNSSIANPPTITLSQNAPTIPVGGSATSILNFTTTASTTLGLYVFTVNATVNSQQHGATFALAILPPDFQVTATPQSLNITAGGVKTSTITVKALGQFAGTVNLSLSSTPLVQASLDKVSVTLSSTVTSINSTLTVSPNPYVLPGNYYVSVDGTSTTATTAQFPQHSTYIQVTIPGPEFEITPGYSSLTVSPGNISNSTLTLTSISGFAGTIGLSTSSYGGILVAVSPSSVTLSSGSSAQAKVSITMLPGGGNQYASATITAVSGIVSRTAYFQVSAGGSDFSVAASPGSIQFVAGKTVNSTITLRSLNGFTGTLSLAASASGNPIGFVLSASSATLSSGGSFNSTLTISMPSTVSPSYFFVDVYASNGTVTHYANVEISPLFVPPPPPSPTAPDFAVSVLPTFITLNDGGSAASTATVKSLNGFAGTLSLSVFVSGPYGNCPGNNCLNATLTVVSITLTASGSVDSSLNLHALGNAPAGVYNVYVEASNATVTRYAQVEAVVIAPDFQVDLNIGQLTLRQGDSATPAIVMASQDNFSGTLSVNATFYNGSCAGCPVLSLNPKTVSLPANGSVNSALTVTTSSATVIGSYYVTITVTNGTLLHTTNLSVNVIGPDFEISAGSGALILPIGSSRPVLVTIVSLNGFSGKVDLSAATSNQPLSVSPAAVNATVPADGWTSFTITVSAISTTTPGSYFVIVNGQNNTLSHTAYVNIIVPGPSFGLSTPDNYQSYYLTAQAGSSNSTLLTVPSYDGFKGTVTFSRSSLYGPTYPTCPGSSCPTISFNPVSALLKPAGWNYTSVTFSFPISAVPGYYYATVNATSGSITRQVYLSIDVRAAPERLVSIVQGIDGSLWSSTLSGSWSSLSTLGGSTKSTPTICSSPGRADLVVRGFNNATYHKSFTNGAWSTTWDSPPGGLTRDQPACAVMNGVLYVAIRGMDNGTWLISRNGTSGAWSTWTSLGAASASAPILVAEPNFGGLDIVIRGVDNAIWHTTYYPGGFHSPWGTAGGITAGVPSVVSNGTALHVVVRGTDGSLWYNSYSLFGGVWSGYQSLSGATSQNAALYIDSLGTVHLIVTGTGTSGSLWHKTMLTGGTWSPTWDSLGGIVTSSPSVATLGASTLVSVRGQDGRVWYATLTGSTLTGWLTAGGITAGDPQLGVGS